MNDFFPNELQNGNNYERKTEMDRTIITKDTVIVGTIAAESSILVNGAVKGDVYSKSAIELTGKVDGNIKANDVQISNGAVKGDVGSEGNILVSGDSVIVGNIIGSALEFNGKIKGNVRIEGHAIIRDNAVIQGNLSAQNFTVDDGAKIIGFVEIIQTAAQGIADDSKIEEIITFDDITIPADAGTAKKAPPAPLLPVFVKEEPKPVENVFSLALEDTADEKASVATATHTPETKKESEEAVEDFADEKQKMLQDLRSRMEKAKKSGQSL